MGGACSGSGSVSHSSEAAQGEPPNPDGLAEAELDGSIEGPGGAEGMVGAGGVLAWEGPETTDDVGGGLI